MAPQAQRHIAPAKLPNDTQRLSIIIPAAGIGKRMKSKGPKALLSVHNGMSILECQLRTILKVYPSADIVVVGGFEHQKIRQALWGKFPMRLVCNPNYEDTNTVHSIAIGLDATLPGPVMVIHGDLVFNTHTIQGLEGKASSLLVDQFGQLGKEEVGIGQQDGLVTSLSYALSTKWGQMAYLQGKELELFRNMVFSPKNANLFLYEILNKIMNKHGKFVAHMPKDSKLIDVDHIDDLQKARLV